MVVCSSTSRWAVEVHLGRSWEGYYHGGTFCPHFQHPNLTEKVALVVYTMPGSSRSTVDGIPICTVEEEEEAGKGCSA